jgi:membrane-bound ClpP family serine protease
LRSRTGQRTGNRERAMDESLSGPEQVRPVPVPRRLVPVRGILLGTAGGVVGLLAVAVALLSVFASGGLPWLVGTVLAAAVVGVVVAGFHAGGHGWFVPLPALVLAVAWAVAASAGGWASASAWVLAALAFASALGAFVLVLPAIAYRGGTVAPVGTAALVGASGKALTALSPKGICQVNKETWTAESLSGPLPAGAPVHVARVDGLRLLVWSEAGTVPGSEVLAPTKQEKEDA